MLFVVYPNLMDYMYSSHDICSNKKQIFTIFSLSFHLSNSGLYSVEGTTHSEKDRKKEKKRE